MKLKLLENSETEQKQGLGEVKPRNQCKLANIFYSLQKLINELFQRPLWDCGSTKCSQLYFKIIFKKIEFDLVNLNNMG